MKEVSNRTIAKNRAIQYRVEKTTMKILKYLLAIVLPPVAILFTYGVSSALAINIGLTLLGWVPGTIHALWAISKHEEKFGSGVTNS